MRLKTAVAAAAVMAGLGGGLVRPTAQSPDPFNEQLLRAFSYRNLGPFRMGARTSDIAVPTAPAKDHLYTFYVGFWTGGLWKTTNNGTTFEPVFDGQKKLAIGDVTVAPSNANIVWVGTGDAFTSRSSYAGDGVYKSTDAGKTWTNMGLRDSHHIARIAIHPTNPDVVYVASMGHLYSENAERGVFKTTNGGTSWEKVLFVNDRIGVVDLAMNPRNPEVLYAAAYDKQRLPWQMVNGGPESGIYKSADGGRTWARLRGGLPDGRIGRIGLDIFHGNPDIVYAVIENQNPRPVTAGAPPGGPGAAGTTYGGQVYRTDNAGTAWTRMSADEYNVSPKGPYYFSQIRVDPGNEQHVLVTQDGFRRSLDGGRTWNAPGMFPRMFGDYRTLWIDPQNPDRMIAGSDAGVVISYDGGRTGDHYANIPVGEIYSIGVDMDDPYNSDGKVQVTRNDGAAWTDATARITAAGGRGDAYVSRVRASAHAAGRAYVSKSGYRFDDFKPCLYRTEDFGATWASIASNLPNEPINVVYEDQRNPDLLFAGNDTGVFVSIDRGARWVKMNNNMPNVAVHDLLVHPRENDLILGTYGRDLWVTNIGALQELTPAVLASDVHLFSIKPAVQRVTWVFGANDYLFGQRHLSTPNEPNGMVIRYYLKSPATGSATVVVADASGQEVTRLQGTATAGINTVVWSTRQGGGRGAAGGGRGAGACRGGGGGAGRGGPSVLEQLAPLGEYTVTLEVGERRLTQKARIAKTQGWPLGAVPRVIR